MVAGKWKPRPKKKRRRFGPKRISDGTNNNQENFDE
jgi:hypothetical protein